MALWIAGVKRGMERKGTVGAFSAAAKRAGTSTAGMISRVLAKGSNYSTQMKRRAVLARTFARLRRRRRVRAA